MDEIRPLFPRHDLCGRIDSDTAPTGGRFPIEPESSQVVYCGDAQQVSEGFAVALRAMGVEANFLLWGIAPDTETPNREDN